MHLQHAAFARLRILSSENSTKLRFPLQRSH